MHMKEVMFMTKSSDQIRNLCSVLCLSVPPSCLHLSVHWQKLFARFSVTQAGICLS